MKVGDKVRAPWFGIGVIVETPPTETWKADAWVEFPDIDELVPFEFTELELVKEA